MIKFSLYSGSTTKPDLEIYRRKVKITKIKGENYRPISMVCMIFSDIVSSDEINFYAIEIVAAYALSEFFVL